MNRETWFLNKANLLLDLLPPNARALLSRLESRAEPRQIEHVGIRRQDCRRHIEAQPFIFRTIAVTTDAGDLFRRLFEKRHSCVLR